MRIIPQKGLTFELDLSESSTMYSPVFPAEVQILPVLPNAYGHFYAGPRHFTERRSFVRFYQVFLTHSGAGKFIVDGREYIAGSDSVCILNCGTPSRYETHGEMWNHEWVNFSGQGADAYYNLIAPDGFRVFALNGNSDIPLIFKELSEHYMEQDTLGVVHTSTRLIRLLDAIYTLAVEEGRNQIDMRRGNLQMALDHIQTHYAEHITLDELAAVACLSKYHFSRVFKDYTGMAPYEYLNSIRLSHARTLLITTGLSIEEIAWQTGFQSSKNMIRVFKQAFGLTPGQCRKNGGIWEIKSKELIE